MEKAVQAALNRRLDPTARAPIVVALSGGGDSIALLRLTVAWAAGRGRPVLALTVDHGLNADSAAWTAFAGAQARALGCAWRGLSWTGPKPTTGIPAAARTARHALLADAARQAGAGVILTGHTADDVLEGELMRAHDAPTLGALHAWSPSPAWPEGRGVFLLRPLLSVRRAVLRAWLQEQGAAWLDDPANDDPRHARARARAALHTRGPETPVLRQAQDEGLYGERSCAGSDAPAFHLSPHPEPVEGRGLFPAAGVVRLSGADTAPTALSAALLCAAGTRRPPRADALFRLQARIAAGEDFAATLAGARVEARSETVLVTRESGEFKRRPLAPLLLPLRTPVVWDGRFEITADASGLSVVALSGHAARLTAAERRAIAALPPAARAALPTLLGPGRAVSLPAPFGAGPALARCLVGERFDAAVGALPDERALSARAAPPHGAARTLTLS